MNIAFAQTCALNRFSSGPDGSYQKNTPDLGGRKGTETGEHNRARRGNHLIAATRQGAIGRYRLCGMSKTSWSRLYSRSARGLAASANKQEKRVGW